MALTQTSLELHNRDGIINAMKGIKAMDIAQFDWATVTLLSLNKYGMEYPKRIKGVPLVKFLHGGGRSLDVVTASGKVIEIYHPAFNNYTNYNVVSIKFYNN